MTASRVQRSDILEACNEINRDWAVQAAECAGAPFGNTFRGQYLLNAHLDWHGRIVCVFCQSQIKRALPSNGFRILIPASLVDQSPHKLAVKTLVNCIFGVQETRQMHYKLWLKTYKATIERDCLFTGFFVDVESYINVDQEE